MKHRSDPELVQACLDGNTEAWDTLVSRYGRLIYSIPMRLGLGETDADDVFQIVMGIVLRRLASLRDESRLSAWLIRVTYRESWRHAKKQRAKSGSELDESHADEGAATEDQVIRLERQQMVREAVAELDERCAKLVSALYFDKKDASYEELADQLGMRVGSIGPTRARCFKKLERLLGQRGL